MTHAKGSAEWLKFNHEKLSIAAGILHRLMDKAGLFPERQERLRRAFRFATNDSGMSSAVNVEKRLQAEETREYHRQHIDEYLNAAGVKLSDLPTEGVQ
jgi:hypothetical protein